MWFFVYISIKVEISCIGAITMLICSYALQDLAHLGTGEKTHQSSYSNGGHIDFQNPSNWSKLFFEQIYYMVPLIINSFLSIPTINNNFNEILPNWMLIVLDAPLPQPMQRLRTAAKILLPIFTLTYGSYCLDTKNAWCFFPGTPYYHRVLQITGIILALSGFIIAITKFNVSETDGKISIAFIHGICGFIVMLLGFLQPINAYFRPEHTHLGKEPTWLTFSCSYNADIGSALTSLPLEA